MKKIYFKRNSVEHGMFQDTTTKAELPDIDSWDFIEAFYPDYYTSDDVFRNDILSKYIDHIEHGEEIDEEYIKEFEGQPLEQVKAELAESNEYLKNEASRHFYEMLHSVKISIINVHIPE